MAKEEISRTGILQELQKIALSRPNAGVELAYMERPTKQMIRRLDLSAISEFKRNSAGRRCRRFMSCLAVALTRRKWESFEKAVSV